MTNVNFENGTTSYVIANNKNQKKPIFYVKFGLVVGPLGTNSQLLPNQYATGPIANPTMTRKLLLSKPTAAPTQLNLTNLVASLSSINFNLNDNNGEITTIVTSVTMKNRLTYIFKGYEGMSESDFISIYVGQIDNVVRSMDGTYYTFTVTDPQKSLTTDIFTGHAQLTQDFNPGDNFIFVNTSYYFAVATDLGDGFGLRNYLKIDSALFSYTGNAKNIVIDNNITWTYIGGGSPTQAPQWSQNHGQTQDGTVFWEYAGGTTATQSAPLWVHSTVYSTGQQVSNAGNIYQCTSGGTSASSGPGPTVVGYTIGTKVYNLGNIYQCLIGGTSGSLNIGDGSASWRYVSPGTITGSTPQWLASHSYSVGNQVYNYGNIYQCVTAGTSNPSGGPSGIPTPGPSGFGTTANVFYGIQQVVLNANGEATPQQHQAGAQVDNYVLFQGNPVDLMLQIIMSTGTGLNWSGTGTNYDVLPASQGIGVPYSLVNIANFQSQKGRFLSWINFYGFANDQTSAIKFFQDHFFVQTQCYIFTNKSGQLDFKAIYYPLPTDRVINIDITNDIQQTMRVDLNLQTSGDFLNEVVAVWDYQPIPDIYTSYQITDQLASQQTYCELATTTIECNFVVTHLDGNRIVNRMTNIMLKRFSNPLPVITMNAFSQLQLVNPGDTILLTSSQLPNYSIGGLGGSVLCEVITAGPDFANDRTQLTLFCVGFASNKRYGVIGPAGMPNYPTASPTQKNYAFASALVPGNPEVGYQSNGDPGYYIGG